jgi:hypothetical protein
MAELIRPREADRPPDLEVFYKIGFILAATEE